MLLSGLFTSIGKIRYVNNGICDTFYGIDQLVHVTFLFLAVTFFFFFTFIIFPGMSFSTNL